MSTLAAYVERGGWREVLDYGQGQKFYKSDSNF